MQFDKNLPEPEAQALGLQQPPISTIPEWQPTNRTVLQACLPPGTSEGLAGISHRKVQSSS